jgi:hypothetical protein
MVFRLDRANQLVPVQQIAPASSIRSKCRSARGSAWAGSPERLFIKIKFQEGTADLNYSATFRYQSTLLPREKLGKGKL